ncbi:MAG: C39 family peptidase [Gemmatimonadaceae bacterium]
MRRIALPQALLIAVLGAAAGTVMYQQQKTGQWPAWARGPMYSKTQGDGQQDPFGPQPQPQPQPQEPGKDGWPAPQQANGPRGDPSQSDPTFTQQQGDPRQMQYVGIKSTQFEDSYSAQHNSQWCWAASIQMVLAYYGMKVTQEQIVQRSFGEDTQGQLPNKPGSSELITQNLNNWNVDAGGTRYHVTAQVGRGAPPPTLLLQEVKDQHPVILAYMSGPSSGHAVVATAAGYTPSDNGPIVREIIVRDPWPSDENKATHGRVSHPGDGLARNVANYWIIRVEH